MITGDHALRNSSSSLWRDRLVCFVSLLLLPVLFYGAIGAFRTNSNNVLDWLPVSFDETQRLFQFVERFGSDEILLVSWDGCEIDDPRLEEIADALMEPVADPKTGETVHLFRAVLTGKSLLDQLMDEPLEIPRDEAIERLKGWVIGPDGTTTCAVALVSEIGSLQRDVAIEQVKTAAEQLGLAWDNVYVGGPTADAVAIDDASSQGIASMAIGSCLVGLVLAAVLIRSPALLTCILFSAVVAWGASLSAVYVSGTNMDAILLMMPALVFILAMSGGIHLSNYCLDALREDPSCDPATMAIRRGWLPCVLSSTTTAIGLGSLMTSQLVPVRKFGLYSALGMLLIIFALLVVWPAMVRCWPWKLSKDLTEQKKSRYRHWWIPVYHFATRNKTLILLGCFCLFVPLSYGVSQLQTSVTLEDLLGNRSKHIQSGHWLQEHIGALTPVEVVLDFEDPEEDDEMAILRRAQLTDELGRLLVESGDVTGAVSATTFAPPIPVSTSARSLLFRRVLAARLTKHREELKRMGLIFSDGQQETWRISSRVTSLQADYAPIMNHLSQIVDEFQSKHSEDDEQFSVVITGGVPLIYMAQQQLLTDLSRSFLLAFLLIALMMIAMVRSISAGLLLMIPNVLPALASFGLMGLLAVSVDIGTMMTASAALGIAVDDTLHFTVWFRRGLDRGSDRLSAVRFAFRHCATPMLQTSLICSLALTVFLVSPFAPIGRFGLVMAVMLILAILGDLVLLPALLISPLGKCFQRRREHPDPGGSGEND